MPIPSELPPSTPWEQLKPGDMVRAQEFSFIDEDRIVAGVPHNGAADEWALSDQTPLTGRVVELVNDVPSERWVRMTVLGSEATRIINLPYGRPQLARVEMGMMELRHFAFERLSWRERTMLRVGQLARRAIIRI